MGMKITVNGKAAEVEAGLNVTGLLAAMKVRMPEMVSVELNGTILRREEFDSSKISEGDRIEFLYYMVGGNGPF